MLHPLLQLIRDGSKFCDTTERQGLGPLEPGWTHDSSDQQTLAEAMPFQVLDRALRACCFYVLSPGAWSCHRGWGADLTTLAGEIQHGGPKTLRP